MSTRASIAISNSCKIQCLSKPFSSPPRWLSLRMQTAAPLLAQAPSAPTTSTHAEYGMEDATLPAAATLRPHSPFPVVQAPRQHRAQQPPALALYAKTTSTPAARHTAAASLLVADTLNRLSPIPGVQLPHNCLQSHPLRPVPFFARTISTVVGTRLVRDVSPVALGRQTRLTARLIALLMRRRQRHSGEVESGCGRLGMKYTWVDEQWTRFCRTLMEFLAIL